METSPLLTDLYQLTMAAGYFKTGKAGQEAVFTLSFRRNPFEGGYAIACGQRAALEWLEGFRFLPDDLAYLATLAGRDGTPLFAADFLAYLGDLRLAVEIDAMPEGSLVFAHEPIMRVKGPLLQAQLLETALLCFMNFGTLVATKAARVCQAAGADPVLEFGLRRAQGADGAMQASYAAHVGGCAATSNVLAGRRFGIPVRGTHAHSWVMSFDSEPEAFAAYAEAMPHNSVFLVDTFDTLQGVRHAIAAGRALLARGHRLGGIRLDSGDLAWLSAEARKLLDAAGFADAAIVASNDLDEHLVASLKQQGAAIGLWGVGTKLVTAYDQPALGGVYKLGALRGADGAWRPKVKLSEQAIKVSIPGALQVRRFERDGRFVADAIYDTLAPVPRDFTIVDPADPTRERHLAGLEGRDVLVPFLRDGRAAGERPQAGTSRARAQAELAKLDPTVRRLVNAHAYPVGLEAGLAARRMELIRRHRKGGKP